MISIVAGHYGGLFRLLVSHEVVLLNIHCCSIGSIIFKIYGRVSF